MARSLLTCALWEVIEPLLPKPAPMPQGGRPPVENRSALTGILLVLETAIPWTDLPGEMRCGSGRTVGCANGPAGETVDRFDPLLETLMDNGSLNASPDVIAPDGSEIRLAGRVQGSELAGMAPRLDLRRSPRARVILRQSRGIQFFQGSLMQTVWQFKKETEFPTPERCHVIEMLNDAGDPQCSIARARVEPGVTTQLHSLSGTAERYVILQGRGKVEIGGQRTVDVQAMDVVHIPAGTAQRITNVGNEDLVFLCICTPRFVEDCYRNLESS